MSGSKLDIEQFLPPPEAFFSSLRNCNTLGHDAAEIQRNYDGLKRGCHLFHQKIILAHLKEYS